MKAFLDALHERPLLGDGAMGTLLYSQGVLVQQCLEALVIESPATIKAIHEQYCCAGADVITTHSFGANRMRLAYHGLEARVRDLNLAAAHLAQEARAAAGRSLWIAGNVGPVGKRVIWEDGAEATAVAAAFREQIEVLAEGGVDLLLLETFSDVVELEVAVNIAREVCALPIVASVSYGADGLTLAGQSVEMVVTRLAAAGVDVIGANCSTGPAQMVATLRAMREAAPHAPLSASPNAGLPVQDAGGRLIYPADAQLFAGYLPQFVAAGARLVGGCCGTTPLHIAAMRQAIDAAQR